MSSRLITLLAPWRTAVPMQSLPVSPPPMTTTVLPAASITGGADGSFLEFPHHCRHPLPTCPPSSRALVFLVRNSMARCTPLCSRPGTSCMSRATVAPTESSKASNWSRTISAVGPMLRPPSRAASPMPPMLPFGPVTKVMPSSRMMLTRRCTTSILSVFMLGTPYIMSPPMRSARSYTVTLWPILLSWSAAARPAGPEPTIPTVFPVRKVGGMARIQPISYALSMMLSSTDLMPTGSSMMPSTQAPSHGAGQTRPVNSGKLFVCIKRLKACCHCPVRTSSFHSGIKLPSGQPDRSVRL
mmetsp:Transcript_51253/g.111215  ORF Transcript_51253/g.111215 Transcript_51253/m.111215 type:complete len:299 (+) Transcript_51253:441-1337(+)